MLEVKNLSIIEGQRKIISHVTFHLKPAQVIGLVGESGAGKTLLGKAIMGLTSPPLLVEGSVLFHGKDLLSLPEKQFSKLRGSTFIYVSQDPGSAFDPLKRIGYQLDETLKIHKPTLKKNERYKSIIEALQKVNLDTSIYKKYSFECSGGMLQRVMLVFVFLFKPEVIIADEPTTNLDQSSKEQFLFEFKKLISNEQASVLFITHELDVIKEFAEEIIVIKDGELIERTETGQFFNLPKHLFSKSLVRMNQILRGEQI